MSSQLLINSSSVTVTVSVLSQLMLFQYYHRLTDGQTDWHSHD